MEQTKSISKRLLAMMLSIAMVLSLVQGVSLTASAETSGDYEYEVLDDGTVEITGYNGSDTELTIPSTIDEKAVTSIGERTFYWCLSLTSVTIPNGVTSIGDYAFSECLSLTSIEIPDSVTSIGNYTFAYCHLLTSIKISDSVKSIGENAFLHTGFYYDEKNWENGILYLEKYLIKANYDISGSLQIKAATKGVADYAFSECYSLRSVTIPDSVTSIGDYAFSECLSLTSVEIPDSVTSIGDCVFASCTSLTSVVIPDSVTSIGNYTFAYCDSLTSATLGNSVENIGIYAFFQCNSLTSIVIPDSVTSIGYGAFEHCRSLTRVTIGNGVESIGDSIFNGCNSLASVTIGNSVENIENWIFEKYASLTSIYVSENNANYSDIDGILYNKDKTKLILYPKGKTDTSYTIPNSVKSIGDYAFYDCDSLTSVTIGNFVESIGNYAFYGSDELTSIVIPNSVNRIGNQAFSFCYSLKSIEVDKDNKNYSSNSGVLFNKVKTTLIQYPASKIDTKYTIPNTLDSVGDGAFIICLSLKTVNYDGTKEQWNKIRIGEDNDYLEYATINFVCKHTKTTVKNKKSATYFAKGYTGDTVCKECNKTIKKGKAIAKKTLKTPKVKVTKGKKQIKVKYTKVSGATGFEVQYKKGKKTVTKTFNTKKSVKKTINKLKKGSYKVKVRAFVKSGTKKAYSNWTKAKTIKI